MRVLLGIAQNLPQGALRHLALFTDCFQGHLGLPQGNGNLFLLACEVFGEVFLYRIHIASAIGGT